MDNVNKLILSKNAKIEYLKKLSKRVIKILYLIEQEKETQNCPKNYIIGQLFEVNSANYLFDFQLTDIIIKLNGILQYKQEPFELVRKQIFEIKNIADNLLKTIE